MTKRPPPLLGFLGIQVLACLLALGLHWLLAYTGYMLGLNTVIGIQALVAAVLGWRLLPPWWLPLNLGFTPALALTIHLGWNPAWAFMGFVVVALLNWNSLGERVPLYLSSRTCAQQLGDWFATQPGSRFIDLGCGLAGCLAYLARRFPNAQFTGVETAPLSFVLAWLRCLPLRNCHIRYRNLWQENLHEYDVVYVFLSPVPMPRLWQHCQQQMRPGTWLISNSFGVPDHPPLQRLELHDWRQGALLLWRW